jgi:hypothetical protein
MLLRLRISSLPITRTTCLALRELNAAALMALSL